jgi:hypothetical protein
MNWLTEAPVGGALLLVVFGGIVGTLLTLAVTWWREHEKTTAARRRNLRWLLAELIDNLEHLEQYNVAEGRAKVQLSTQAWETAKGDILDLDQDVITSLYGAYAEIWRFNGLVEDEPERRPSEDDRLERVFVQSQELKAALSDARSKLGAYLGVSAQATPEL